MISGNIHIDILQFIAVYIYAWIVFVPVGIQRNFFNYISNYKKVSAYFIIATIPLLIIFSQRLLPFIKNFSLIPVIALFVFYTLAFLIYTIMKPLYVANATKGQDSHVMFMACMDKRFLLSKSSDIIFQETLFVILYSFLASMKVPLIGMILISIGITALTHLCMISFISPSSKWYVWYLSTASSLVAIAFPFLILQVAYGFLYTFIIHWTFGFLLLGVWWNITHKVQQKQ